MTRQDLVNKSIDKLNTVKEDLELIEILEYDECIAVLTGKIELINSTNTMMAEKNEELEKAKKAAKRVLKTEPDKEQPEQDEPENPEE